MPSPIIAERAIDFAHRIVKLCERLWDGSRASQRLADQLFEAGTSIGANAEEAEGGQTKADFTARLAIARKESYETVYWLRLAVRAGLVTERDVAWELDEAIQLKRMITRAIHTAQTSSWRGGH